MNLLRIYKGNNLLFKRCSKCKEYKTTDNFNTRKRRKKIEINCKCKNCDSVRKKIYRELNKEKLSYKRKLYKELNKERLKQKRILIHQTEEYKRRNRIHSQKRRALKKGIGGSYTKEQWKQCLEYFDYKDAYTGLPMTIESVDHIIPINKNGTNTIENLVPCEKDINSSKCDKSPWEWYSKKPYFSWERYLKICMWIIKNLP